MMQVSLSNAEFQLFQQYICKECGINIEENKAYLIESRLSKLLVEFGLSSYRELYNIISTNDNSHISVKVIDAITTNETLWFRDKSPWSVLSEVLLPGYIEMLRTFKKTKIRIWSAAASTGQEAYSIAMCIDYYLECHGIKDVHLSQFEIVATDISHTVLEISRQGKYNTTSIMRGLDQVYKDKYFTSVGMDWELNERIKAAVTFKHFNLQNSFLFLGKFDIIFCRYVLIYFSDSLKADIVNKCLNNIESDGVFFIGSSEIYNGLDPRFEKLAYGNGTYYKKRRDQ